MRLKSKNSWYTILITLMIIGFLIVVTTWILNLVIREMKDNRGQFSYLQAYAWAEAAMELALFDIKKYSYGVYNKIILWESFDDSKILRDDPNNKKEVLIWYDLNSKTNNYTWELYSFEQIIIPLFYLSLTSEDKVENISLDILNWGSFTDQSKMAWNIVSENWDWIWWNSSIGSSSTWYGKKSDWSFLSQININGTSWFLDTYSKNYLIITNLDPNNKLNYKLKSLNSWEFFTKPISDIISSAQVWKYKQSLEITLDNTDFLSILRYSLFSN